jgi:hypothetical protein
VKQALVLLGLGVEAQALWSSVGIAPICRGSWEENPLIKETVEGNGSAGTNQELERDPFPLVAWRASIPLW